MNSPLLEVVFDSIEMLVAQYEWHLKNGGLFIPGAHALAEHQDCVIKLVHPVHGDALELGAKVVYVDSDASEPGIGVALANFGPEIRTQIQNFIHGERKVILPKEESPKDEVQSSAEGRTSRPPRVQEKLRGLSVSDQLRVARDGGQEERMALERMYGKSVWEALLRNPRITVPEVARIAKMGSLPQPLLEIITANRTWLASAAVRRSLLTNPRLRGEMITKVIRAMPKPELKLVPKQTAYPAPVRAAAAKILKQQGM